MVCPLPGTSDLTALEWRRGPSAELLGGADGVLVPGEEVHPTVETPMILLLTHGIGGTIDVCVILSKSSRFVQPASNSTESEAS